MLKINHDGNEYHVGFRHKRPRPTRQELIAFLDKIVTERSLITGGIVGAAPDGTYRPAEPGTRASGVLAETPPPKPCGKDIHQAKQLLERLRDNRDREETTCFVRMDGKLLAEATVRRYPDDQHNWKTARLFALRRLLGPDAQIVPKAIRAAIWNAYWDRVRQTHCRDCGGNLPRKAVTKVPGICDGCYGRRLEFIRCVAAGRLTREEIRVISKAMEEENGTAAGLLAKVGVK